MSLPREIMDKLRSVECVDARPEDIYDAAWEINRGRWDISVYELAQFISHRCGRGKMTLDELVAYMRPKEKE